MSENTNTLFWVITGAVIVLAVFLLINSASDSQLNAIANKFDSTWLEISDKSQEDMYASYPDNYIDAKRNKVVVDGLEVGITAYGYLESGNWKSFKYYIKNVSENLYIKKYVYVYIYNKDNDEYVTRYSFGTGTYFEKNKQLDITGGFPDYMPTNYYALVEVKQ